jgi:hypothetical protein
MNKQWIYRNGEKPFSVTEITSPEGRLFYVSMSLNGSVHLHNHDGTASFYGNSDKQLIPYEPYADFKIDDKVYASDEENDPTPLARHFAGLSEDGRPTTFNSGRTSFTKAAERDVMSWKFCKKAEPKQDK